MALEKCIEITAKFQHFSIQQTFCSDSIYEILVKFDTPGSVAIWKLSDRCDENYFCRDLLMKQQIFSSQYELISFNII